MGECRTPVAPKGEGDTWSRCGDCDSCYQNQIAELEQSDRTAADVIRRDTKRIAELEYVAKSRGRTAERLLRETIEMREEITGLERELAEARELLIGAAASGVVRRDEGYSDGLRRALEIAVNVDDRQRVDGREVDGHIGLAIERESGDLSSSEGSVKQEV